MAVGLDSGIVLGSRKDPNNNFFSYGSPVDSREFADFLKDKGLRLAVSSVNENDYVGENIGGNFGLYVAGKEGEQFQHIHHITEGQGYQDQTSVAVSLDQTGSNPRGEQRLTERLSNFRKLFPLPLVDGPPSPHSNYSCVVMCGIDGTSNTKITDKEAKK